jgi:hypothetical protein
MQSKTQTKGTFASTKGKRKGGRKKGTPNKMTVHLRAAILLAGEQLGEMREVLKYDRDGKVISQRWANGPGGLTGYMRWLGRHHYPSYVELLEQVLPAELRLSGPDGGPVQIEQKMSRSQLMDLARARGLPDRIFSDGVKTIEHQPDEKPVVKRRSSHGGD